MIKGSAVTTETILAKPSKATLDISAPYASDIFRVFVKYAT
jgi:hypothetical protein